MQSNQAFEYSANGNELVKCENCGKRYGNKPKITQIRSTSNCHTFVKKYILTLGNYLKFDQNVDLLFFLFMQKQIQIYS